MAKKPTKKLKTNKLINKIKKHMLFPYPQTQNTCSAITLQESHIWVLLWGL